jgi:hypothetical protein
MVTLFKYIGPIYIILLIIAIVVLKKELDCLIKRIDKFDRPSLNRDINNIILCLCSLSCLIGGIFTLIILG